MSETLTNIETVAGVASFVGGIVAKKYGGQAGEAAAVLLLGQASWAAATAAR